MNKDPKWLPKEKTAGEKIVEQIDDALKAFRKLKQEKQEDLFVELGCAIREIRKKQVEAIAREILDVMHIEIYGYSQLHNYQTRKYKRQLENASENVLDAEYLEEK
jgi:hypothetical protein